MTEFLQPIQYKVTATGIKFHNSTKKMKFILGPFGSGKSVMCAEEILYNAMRQIPASNGVRYSRYAVVRKYFPALKTTTRRTLMMCYPRTCGTIKETVPMEGTYNMTFRNADTGEEIKVVMELLLMAIDGSEESLEKLRSLDLTGAWCNEVTEVPYDVITTLNERVGRYPAGDMGTAVEPIILADYNMPPYGHWLHGLKKDHPSFMEFFEQPPAAFKVGQDEKGQPVYETNPNAENLVVLNAGGKTYYRDQIDTLASKGEYSKIDQMLCLIPGVDESGKPVFGKNYDPAFHKVSGYEPQQHREVIMGVDTSGVHPAAVIGQYFGPDFVTLYELYGQEEGFEVFRDTMLLPLLKTKFEDCEAIAVCDPANAKDSWSGVTPIERLQEVGIKAFPASTNLITPRIEAAKSMLNRRSGGILVSDRCENLDMALSGGYKYRKISSNAGVELYSTTPVKDDHSHYADAFQYLCLYLYGADSNDDSMNVVAQAVNNQLKNMRYY